MKLSITCFILLIFNISALPKLPLLVGHPPVASRLGDVSSVFFSAQIGEVCVCTIRGRDGMEIKFFLDLSKNHKSVKAKSYEQLLKSAQKILEEALPAENLEGAEMVGSIKALRGEVDEDIWIFQYIVKDFTPAGGAGYFPTVLLALRPDGTFLGRTERNK